MKGRILVVDDDDGVRVTVEHVLSSCGYEIATASNGVEALRLIEAFEPQLILTDLIMPEFDVIERISKAKECWPKMKIIAMSGGARIGNDNILKKARENGADAVIAKPFEFDELKSLIERSIAVAS